MICPECNDERKHKGKKSFSFNKSFGTGFCHNCNNTFVTSTPFIEKKKIYKIPVQPTNTTKLDDKCLEYFKSRGISQQTVNKLKIYSDVTNMPESKEKVTALCFPFYNSDLVINIKYRDARKKFKLVSDAELIFYNINCLLNAEYVIITEGEFDCLSFIEAGFENTISVPNGASAANLSYLDNYIDLFVNIPKVYIATDNDIAGFNLREELIRRIGDYKCYIVNFGECKDANEYLVSRGVVELKKLISSAKEYPIRGILDVYDFKDSIIKLWQNGYEKGRGIGVDEIDKIILWESSRLCVVTGVPGHGKSEFIDFIIAKLNFLYGWKAGLFTPENYPLEYYFDKIFSKFIGRKLTGCSEFQLNTFMEYFDNNFYIVYPEDDLSIDSILEKAKYLVSKYGIKVFVIDPYNKLEHLLEKGDTETNYISKLLDKLTSFAKRYDVLVILIAHPAKPRRNNDGSYPLPSLYDISGSANFFNKCDYGLVVYRDYVNKKVEIHAPKIKFSHLGENGGMAVQMYNYNNGRYECMGKSIEKWDNSNWLFTEPEVLESNIKSPEPKSVEQYIQKSIEDIKISSEVPF